MERQEGLDHIDLVGHGEEDGFYSRWDWEPLEDFQWGKRVNLIDI